MFESRLLHGQPARGLEPRPETGCGLPVAVPGGVPVAHDGRKGMDAFQAHLAATAGELPASDREAIARQAARRKDAQIEGRPHGHIREDRSTRAGR
jgi:hypothetical protein